jgi:probable selenium-dependent hydroxylase accessory protein YqeC
VVSARALGQSVTDRIAHRPALVAAVCGLAPDQAFAPEHLARLLASPEGSLRGVGTTATVVPVINMVDDEALAALARRAALEALALTDRFDRVLLASMRREQPIVEVVRRA